MFLVISLLIIYFIIYLLSQLPELFRSFHFVQVEAL